MGQRIELSLNSKTAQRLQKIGREFLNDYSLGMQQSCAVLLTAIGDGEYELVRVKEPEPEPEPEEEV